jgi:RNA polymerase sigma-70 factor (ECF subfamily)
MDHTGKELTTKLQEGDKATFDFLFRAHYPGLCAFARTYVRSADTAEELVQEVFVKIWERHQRLIIHTSVKSYLYQSVFNSCITYIKTARAESGRHADPDDPAVRNELMLTTPGPDEFETLFNDEAERDLEDAINSLPEQCREIFTLCRYGNLSYKEISKKMDISGSTVKTQMSRAMNRIMKQMKKYF